METTVPPTEPDPQAEAAEPEVRLIEVKNVDGEPHDVGGARVLPGNFAWVDADDPNVISLLAVEALLEVPAKQVAEQLPYRELIDAIKTASSDQLDAYEQAEKDRGDDERPNVHKAIAHRRDELAASATEGAPS